MCGIFGLVVSSGSFLSRNQWQDALTSLFLLSESRGKEAAGMALATAERIVVHKDSVSAGVMLAASDFKSALERGINGFFDRDDRQGSLAAIGHCRLVTNGLQGIDANNQPVWRDNAVIVHNGIVVNVDELWAREAGKLQPMADVDTEVIATLVEKYRATGTGPSAVSEAIQRTFADISGETSIAMLFRDLNVMALGTNTGSLFLVHSRDGEALFFASEAFICKKMTEAASGLPEFEGQPWLQVKAGEGMIVDLDALVLTGFPLDAKSTSADLSKPNIAPRLAGQRAIEDKAKRHEDARRNLRRCTRCILPETMPYISFDAAGVCNYCHSYKPWVRRPEQELSSMLNGFRSKSGSADCIVAFSGGRDSSYGLHLLKTKFDMKPICFSYDWGMVTDLARRNQARMCGELGIEHIWISADIKKKRDNIRRNVKAWMRKPDLGIIPLFMAGDKQFYWYANSMIKQTGINFLVWFTNRYEKTDFKTGFLGIRSADSEMRNRPASMRLVDKANILWQYGKRFGGNPRYFNRSVPDTLGAFASYYFQPQEEHVYFFDYLKWDEDEVNRVLLAEYGWETAKDTNCTWRIGDGTAPFYNYIYYTVAGFTEHDTFRSNQIREGDLSRNQALAMIEVENRPRWPSIREYTLLANLDFDEIIRVIDRIPKHYAH